MKKFFSFVAAVLFAGSMMADVETVYNWADSVGTSTMGTSVEATTVKIHTNTDAVNCIKFSSSYVYAEGKYLTIKPAEGGFKAGDVLSVAIVFNNADDTKYAQVDLRAANGDTRIWLSDSASTINGRTSAAEPIVQTYTLEADQDSLLLGRYGNTAMCVTLLSVTREAIPAVHQYEVAEAIAAGLQDDEEILVRGVITKMEIKGKNFAKYGSVNIYVADATGAEGEFEFYNCYSLNADTFRTTTPDYDATSTAWAQLEEVVDGNGNTIQLGDTVIALGKYKLFNTTHELNTGCYLVDVKHAEAEPIVIANLTYGMVFTEDFAEWGAVDVLVTNQPIVGEQIVGDGYIVAFDILPENANNITGTYSALAESLDLEYSGITQIAGTDTIDIELADGEVAFQLGQYSIEAKAAQLAMAAELVDVDGNVYIVGGTVVVYYDFLPEEQGVENVAAEQKKVIKKIEMGNVVIEKNGVRYNVNGAVVR